MVIGCGGGGGAGGGTVTTGTGTTGVTAGTNTNGTTTSGTTTSGTTTSGTTTSGTTTSGTTTSGTTTSGTTTSGTTTSGTTGSTTGSIPNNKIFYSVGTGSSTEAYFVNPDGSGETLFATLPEAYGQTVGANPQIVEFAFPHTTAPGTVGAKYGIFLNSTVNIAGASQVAGRNYEEVGSIQFTPNGQQILFTASLSEGDYGLYRVNKNGTGLVKIDDGEDLDISPDGLKVAYTKLNGGAGDIYVRNVDGSGTATRLTTSTSEDWMPRWSKSGTKITFSSSRTGDQFDIFTMNANGTAQVNVTNTTSVDEYGPSYSATDAQLSFVVLALDPAQTGLFRIDASGTNRTSLKLLPNINLDTWWSPGTGSMPTRGFGGLSISNRLARRKG